MCIRLREKALIIRGSKNEHMYFEFLLLAKSRQQDAE